jgi:hypothetical protein
VSSLEIHLAFSRAWCSGILYRNGYFDVLAAVIETIPLHNVQLLHVGRPKMADRNAIDEPDRVNNQCISILVMANGFSVDRMSRIPAVRHLQRHPPHLRVALPHDPDLLRGLDENDGLAGK